MKKAHSNPKSLKWIITLAIMIVVSIIAVVATVGITKLASNGAGEEVNISVSKTTPLSVKENELNVTGVEKGFDAQGNLVAYVVKTSTVGYNADVPIELASTISADGKYIVGIDVLKQEETEYLGVRIQTDEFKNQFKGIKAPAVSSASIEKGSKVDLLAKSTISSEAVLEGVNGATQYVNEFLIDE